MDEHLKILFIEDSEDDYELLLRELRKSGYRISSERVETVGELEQCLSSSWDLVISDNSLPRLNAATALNVTRCANQNVPFLIVSGTIGEEAAVEAMRAGANDYILKDNLKRLIPAIQRELKESKNRLRSHVAEQKLEKTQKMYQFLSGSIKDCFIALDHELKIIHWNAAARKEFSIKDKILNRSVFSLFPEWKSGRIERRIRNVEGMAKSENISFEYASKEFFDGSLYPTEEGISIILRKVTEKKRAEENLRKLNHELETLMYRISHDLKGPVASIMGLINVGQIDFEATEFHPYLQMLDKSVYKLQNTLESLSNITRIKQGDIVAEKVVLQEVIDDVTEGIRCHEDHIAIEIQYDLNQQHYAYTDRRLLMSIFYNLLDNAVKYKNTSPKVRPWVSITASKVDGELHVQIEDNGEGISANLQARIFDMFYRANEYSSGAGLGLYIVRNAVEKIRGSVNLWSKKGKGTKVDIVIPDWHKKFNLKQ